MRVGPMVVVLMVVVFALAACNSASSDETKEPSVSQQDVLELRQQVSALSLRLDSFEARVKCEVVVSSPLETCPSGLREPGYDTLDACVKEIVRHLEKLYIRERNTLTGLKVVLSPEFKGLNSSRCSLWRLSNE